MRKIQRYALATMIVLMIAQSIQAKPRDRRRNRRSKVTYNNPQSYSTNRSQFSTATTPFPQGTAQNQLPAPSNNQWVTVTEPYNASSPATATVIRSTTTPTPSPTPPRTLDAGDLLPADPTAEGPSTVANANYIAMANTTTVASAPVVQTVAHETPWNPTTQPIAAPAYATASSFPSGSAMAEVNAIRMRRGLRPFIEDPALSAVARQKASIQANRGAMGHPGGSMGGARFEGVGMGAQFTSCYLTSSVGQYAGAASVRGANGRRYHCLLIK